MARRKTISVRRVVEMANHYLEWSEDKFSEERKGVANFVANILHETGNYNGFNYLGTESDIWAGHYGEAGRVFFYFPYKGNKV